MTQTLAHALRARRDDGRTVPVVFPSWEDLGIRPRFGQVMMVAASPGGAKSALIAHYVRKLRLPSLYFSADTDTTTFTLRSLADVTGLRTTEVEELLAGPDRQLYLNRLANETDHIWVSWEASPRFMDLEEEVEVFAMVHGEYPKIIVMDNLKDLAASDSGGAEHEAYDRGIQFLHEMARRTGALAIVLHHTLGEYENGDIPVPLSGLKGKVGKTPRLILTLHRGWNPKIVNVCLVKNTGGPHDTRCNLAVPMEFDGERMQWAEYK